MAAACTGGGPPGPSAGETAGTSTPNPVVSFEPRGGDAFAWSERVAGSARCTGLKLLENGAATNTSVSTSGSTFSATVTLAPGTNSIVATCTSPDGTTLRSEPMLWD